MKVLKYLVLFFGMVLFTYYYGDAMRKDGLLNGILFFTVGIPLALLWLYVLNWTMNKMMKKAD